MRKEVNGEFRNKERTKSKLIAAVSDVLLNDGYDKLGINRVSKRAGVDKKLIYRYYGGFDELMNSYFREKDFWTSLNNEVFAGFEFMSEDYGRSVSVNYLIELLNSLKNKEETRKILLWEISEENKLLKDLSYEREMMGEELFKMTDSVFDNSKIDLRACYALLLGGVYYLSLHSKATSGNFCGVDITKEEGGARVNAAISTLMNLLYDNSGK